MHLLKKTAELIAFFWEVRCSMILLIRRYLRRNIKSYQAWIFTVSTLVLPLSLLKQHIRLQKLFMSGINLHLIIYGISPRDLTSDFDVRIRPLTNEPWINYQAGDFTFPGWLKEHSFAFRFYVSSLTLINPDNRASLLNYKATIKADGFNRVDRNTIGMGGQNYIKNWKPNADDMRGLKKLLRMGSGDSISVVLAEAPVHDLFLPIYVEGSSDKYFSLFQQPVNELSKEYDVVFLKSVTTSPSFIPNEDWGDVKHLNYKGAELFSRWLAEQLWHKYRIFNYRRSIPTMMQLISWQFAAFVLGLLIVYNLLGQREQKILLLAASIVLIGIWSMSGLGVILLSILVNYFIGNRIWGGESKQIGWLRVGVVFNLALIVLIRLVTTKSLIQPIIQGLALGKGIDFNWLLPVGYLFYTLQAISYLIDIYQRQVKPAENLLDFALYMSYFPRMQAGPIERAKTFLPQLSSNRIVDASGLQRAFVRILTGLIRKLVIANALSSYLPLKLFSQPDQFSTFQLISGVFVYSFWIYNDFAGYTDIVRGVSGLFGIELSANFKTPYLATGFSDFWNRWHMTLSHWLRDYIYFPLSRSLLRRKMSPKSVAYIAIPPIVTMLISGLWHAFGAYMLAWGFMHGVYQATEKYISTRKPALLGESRRWFAAGLAVISPFYRGDNGLAAFCIGKFIQGVYLSKIYLYFKSSWLY